MRYLLVWNFETDSYNSMYACEKHAAEIDADNNIDGEGGECICCKAEAAKGRHWDWSDFKVTKFLGL